ncbi:MAG: glycosyltransferase family 2 protein [Candidatus Altiarchaeota archaeon]
MENSISVILPAYNEEKNIRKAVENAISALEKISKDYEVIVVDDGSKDKTGEIANSLKSEKVKVIHHEKNMGYASALKTGFKNAEKELIFFTDADNQFDLNELKKFVPLSKYYDVVIGYRLNRHDPLHRLIISRCYNFLIRALFGIKVRDIDCAFKLFRKEVIKHIEIKHKGWLINTELMVKILKKGYKFKEVPVMHYPRTEGKTTVSFKSIIETFFGLIRLKIELI